jgi:hypothetical protein
MRIIRFKKSLFSETERGNFFSRLYGAFCTGKLFHSLPESGWGIIDTRSYLGEDGNEFSRSELLAVFESLAEAKELLLAEAVEHRINSLTEEEIDELIASL